MYNCDVLLLQALDYYDKALALKPKDESALLNRAITKVALTSLVSLLGNIELRILLLKYVKDDFCILTILIVSDQF